MYECILKTLLVILFIFLIMWICPSKKVNNKIIETSSTKVLVSSRIEKKIVGYEDKLVISHQEEEKEIIGYELVNTNKYQRIEYLGRYERQEPKTTNNTREYVLVASRRQLLCIKECVYVDIYSYDEYSIKMTKELRPIYKINTIDIYKTIKEPIYKEELVNEYRDINDSVVMINNNSIKNIFLNNNKLVF